MWWMGRLGRQSGPPQEFAVAVSVQVETPGESLPTLDLRRFTAVGAKREEFLREVRAAARGPGFFYLTGHGIEDELTRGVLDLSRRFFALPEADKLAIEMVNSPHFRGYNRAGYEHTRGKPDWREQVDIGPERPALPFDPLAAPWDRLQGPNQWPAALPEFKPTLLAYQERITTLAIRVLQAFAAALEQAEDIFAPIYTPAANPLVKLIRYPGHARDESGQGVGAHKDSGFVTILLQDRQDGLQVESDDGGWIDAPPVAGTFVVNIGEILEMASNGYLRANVHRVVSPPAGGERLSVALFLGARHDATVPLLELPPHLAAQARGVTQDPQNPLFREIGRNYLKSRLRSHPDVARRHYADLLDPTSTVTEPASAY
jgi:isopenicillin N synthase-like dioxygenase